MTISLADIFKTIGKMSTAEARNDDKCRPPLKDTFKKLVDLTLPLHLSNMKKEDDDNYACYKFSDKLRGKKWRNYTMDGLNMTLRGDYAKPLSLKGQYGKKNSPPVELHFKIFTEDVPAETTKNKGENYLDAGHINAFILTPTITTILNAKLQNKPLQSMINDENNAKITSYICRFQYWMNAITNNKVHPALIK